jgi:hypothetical protein
MGMGLQGPAGNAAMAGQIRQRLIDQLNQQQAEQHMGLAEREMALRESEAGMRAQEHSMAMDQNAASLEERKQAHAENQANAALTANRTLHESFAPNTPIDDTPENKPLIGRLQMVGGVPMEPQQQERPAVDVGPLLEGDTGAAKKRGYLTMATAKQAEAQASADAKVEAARLAAENRTNDNEQKNLDRIAQIKAAAAGRPVPDKLTKVEHRDPETGRTVIEYLPESQIRGKSFAKGASGATETRLASAQAVNQTGEDIIAQLHDPKVAAALGPAMGRVNSLRELMGNPPPELAGLAGAIESYSIANMGVHGMRSVQGAEHIKKLLDRKHTPESLVETIKGLSQFSNHFMENEGRKSASGSTKPGGSGIKSITEIKD